MRHLFLLFFISQFIFAQNNTVFTFDKSLRLDFDLLSDAQRTEVIFGQMKKEPYWGGSHTNLIAPDLGNFRLQVFDGSQLVFSKGFNSLANEWATLEEAKTEKRLFAHAMQLPFPAKKLLLHLDKRDKQGVFQTIAAKELFPDDYFIIEEKQPDYPIKQLLNNGNAAKKVDIVILAEGYTAAEAEKFYTDAQRMTDYMFTIPPFDKLKKDFNVYAIERYLTTNSMKAIADAASAVPYDQVYILVNTSIYGGGAFYNHLNLASADNELAEKVYIHEFGHGFVGLADEYYYDWDPTFQETYDPKIEPWEENITTLVNFESKWQDMVKKSIPIPTPRISKYQNTLGAFEGGGYTSKGVYSPMQDCRMKSNDPKGFCPVCERAIRKIVDFYTK